MEECLFASFNLQCSLESPKYVCPNPISSEFPRKGKAQLKEYKKDVIVFLHDPRKTFFHVVVELKNEPGAIASVANSLAGTKINMLSGFISAESERKEGVWSFFAEAKTADVSKDQIKNLIGSSPYILDVLVNQSRDGTLVEKVHFPLAYNTGQRSLLITQKGFSQMLKKIRDTFGSGGDVIVYDEGYTLGNSDAAGFTSAGQRENTKQLLANILDGFSALGWGRAELISFDPDLFRIVIRMRESMECFGQNAPRPYSHFIRGNLAGLFSRLTDGKVNCEETKCISTGDEYCEFSVSKI